ncbi:hypothetical protein Tco_0767985 [Tanacetum coccineum]
MSGTISPPLGASSRNNGNPNRPITSSRNAGNPNRDLPQLLNSRGGSHVTNVPAFDVDDFTSWKEGSWSILMWSPEDKRLANQDKRLKSIIISYLPNDVMKSVIKCTTAKSMWNDLILSHERPFDTRDTKIAALRLNFNAFKALKASGIRSIRRIEVSEYGV